MDSHLPLAGLCVVELHAIGPVPFAGRLLSSLGAQVIRVSPPNDPGLGVSMPAQFDLLNTAKTSQALDLKDPAQLNTLHTLLNKADVLLEGFRPGVLERLGLAPDNLLENHPRLVIGRLSGWGDQGPLAARAGHDINYLALTGVLHAIGTKASPVVPLNLVADFGGGAMHLVVGVLAQLVQRSITGRGGVVSTSITAGTVGLTPMFYGMLAGKLWNTKREQSLLDGSVPFYRVYETQDKKFVAVGALEPKFFAQLVQIIGLQDKVDLKRQYDPTYWPSLGELLAGTFLQQDRDTWAQLALPTDACLSPVLDWYEAAAHPHNQANGWYQAQPFVQPGQVIRFEH
jgi:alpha-methylacyl-CoA racemase